MEHHMKLPEVLQVSLSSYISPNTVVSIFVKNSP